MSDIKLKPCPFCGNPVWFNYNFDLEPDGVKCQACEYPYICQDTETKPAENVDMISRQQAAEALNKMADCGRGIVDAVYLIEHLPPARLDLFITEKIDKAYDDGYKAGYLQGEFDARNEVLTEKDPEKAFAERLAAEIDRLGISNREFADRAGLTAPTICRYLNRERIPKADAVLKCAKALGVTCDYLLGLSDDPHKTGKQGST